MFFHQKLSRRTFNLVLGGLILYGLLANVLMTLFCGPIFARVNPIALMIGWLVLALIGIFCGRSSSLKLRFLAYNLIVIPFGAVLSVLLPAYAAKEVFLALVLTAVITSGMILLSTLFPAFFSRLGGALLLALLLTIVAELIALLMGYSPSIFSWIGVGIFSLYIGYDWYRAQTLYPDFSNAIEAAVDLYLDIINIFLDLLDLLDLLD